MGHTMERRYDACRYAAARTGFGIRTLRPGLATQHLWHVIRSIRPNVRYSQAPALTNTRKPEAASPDEDAAWHVELVFPWIGNKAHDAQAVPALVGKAAKNAAAASNPAPPGNRSSPDRVLVCNSVAQSIIESVRDMHPEFVFVYSHRRHKTRNYRPIETMNNTAWQGWRERCGLHGFRIHDLRHTVGMRLREAGVPESRADVLWHSHVGMTAHYSVAQVVEIREALEKTTDEKHANNVPLASIIREGRVPTKIPTEAKQPEAVLASGR